MVSGSTRHRVPQAAAVRHAIDRTSVEAALREENGRWEPMQPLRFCVRTPNCGSGYPSS
jgi:hypothetical protein